MMTYFSTDIVYDNSTCIVIAFFSMWILRKHLIRDPREPKRVSSWVPYFGVAFKLNGNCLNFFAKCREQVNDEPIFTARLMGKDCHFVVDSKYVIDVPYKRAPQMDGVSLQKLFLRNNIGITYAETETLCSPEKLKVKKELFHQNLLHKESGSLQSLVETSQIELLKLTSEGQGDNTATLLHRFAIDLAVRVSAAPMISLSLTTQKDLPEKLLTFLNGTSALIAGVPWLLLPDVIKARDDIEKMFEAKEFLENATDFTLRRKEIANAGVIRQTQRVWIKTQVAALTATTANFAPTLSWILFHLLDDHVAYNAVEKEAIVLGEKKIYDLEDLDGLPVLSSVIKETIRLHSVHFPTKDIVEDFEVKLGEKTYLLKKGSRLMSYTPIKHYDPYLFSNPFDFQYDRFLGDDKKFYYKDGKDARDPIAAFGGGAQLCPGRRFTPYVLKTTVVRLMNTYNMELLANAKRPEDFVATRAHIVFPTDVHFKLEKKQQRCNTKCQQGTDTLLSQTVTAQAA